MKKSMILALGLLFMTFSCEKNDKENDSEDVPCAVVANADVPTTVSSAFEAKYAGRTVVKWFNKDNHGFAALFDVNGVKTLAEFNNDGTFVKEEIDEVEEEEEHDGIFGNHDEDDDENEDDGCECEME